VQGGWPGQGNIDADPLFADSNSGDYHLKSQAGRWDPDSASWIKDDVTSLCIDAGDPSSDWASELWPHGKRINMGAFGGTTQASMSQSSLGNVADLNNDGTVDWQDFARFTDSWQADAMPLAEDLDRNGIVDFRDVAILGDNWLWPQ
jgi:hypothetical protein